MQPVPEQLLPDHPRANAVMTLGALSVALAAVGVGLLGPVVLVMTHRVRREVAARPGLYRTRGPVRTAWICGWVATALLVVWTVGLVILFYLIGRDS